MILAVLIDGDGRPVCFEMWPGNTADVTSLVPVIDRLRRRFAIGRVCVVADRGMISAETIAALEQRGLLYILGVRERTDKLVRDVVLNDAAPFVPLIIEKRGSLVTPVTLSKEPVAMDMNPIGTWAETPLPLPTMSDRNPCRGGCG
jgi:transposase